MKKNWLPGVGFLEQFPVSRWAPIIWPDDSVIKGDWWRINRLSHRKPPLFGCLHAHGHYLWLRGGKTLLSVYWWLRLPLNTSDPLQFLSVLMAVCMFVRHPTPAHQSIAFIIAHRTNFHFDLPPGWLLTRLSTDECPLSCPVPISILLSPSHSHFHSFPLLHCVFCCIYMAQRFYCFNHENDRRQTTILHKLFAQSFTKYRFC